MFLRFVGLSALVFACACDIQAEPDAGDAAAKNDRRPNIIVVLTDDQRFDAIGALTPGLHTPHMDRLIRDGFHFRNAFVTTSLCSPSRASIISGQTMRNHGVVDNNSPTPDGFEPFSIRLNDSGYETAYVGKWHMGHSDASPKPGFDYWVSFEGQGNYGPLDAYGRPSLLNVNGRETPQTGYITDELTQYALAWLANRNNTPFFLFLSHKAAHLPFTPAERHAGTYDELPIDAPANTDIGLRQGPTPMWLSNQRNSWAGVDFAYYSQRDLADFQRDYYESLIAVDESLGALLKWTEDSDIDRDTIIILTSDNGFMFGEQGLIDKRAAYEASIRVPLILYAPGRFGTPGPVDALARNIDIAPTILDLAGLPRPSHYDGQSLLPDLEARDGQTGRRPLIYEYYWEYNYPQTPSTFALRNDRYKYIQYHGVWDTEELFDLESDPNEVRNLIDEPAYQAVKIQMRADLFTALAGNRARPAIPFTPKLNQGAVFWSPEHGSSTPFPRHWNRTPDSADIYEHLLPDGPEKASQLKQISPAVRAILDPPIVNKGDR